MGELFANVTGIIDLDQGPRHLNGLLPVALPLIDQDQLLSRPGAIGAGPQQFMQERLSAIQ